MQQGDQYELPVRIAGDAGLVITPDNCDDVKIAVGGLGEKTYSSGELTYDNGYWSYPLTQEQTLSFCKPVMMVQAQVKFADGSVVGTPTKAIKIGQSIIRTTWE